MTATASTPSGTNIRAKLPKGAANGAKLITDLYRTRTGVAELPFLDFDAVDGDGVNYRTGEVLK